ncbi:7828_t:CDS:10, partial [Paraglomus occultum]
VSSSKIDQLGGFKQSMASPSRNGATFMSTKEEFQPPDQKDSVPSKTTFYSQLSIRVAQPVGSMSISPSNRDVALAARKGLFIIDLENPWSPPRVLYHFTNWEVADIQWNPHSARDKWVASTSNQKAFIWNLERPEHNTIHIVLHGHTRAISDVNWSPFDPDKIATCSVDAFINLWDLRTPTKPSSSFCAWTAGATQVKFNRKNKYLLASAHDRDLKIWDIRMGSLPITSIRAHTAKIYGIDWSRHDDSNIITCSLDKSVKYWNIHEPGKCQGQILTNSPVWRARHTPVGHGILTMPQRLETTLYLWNREKPEKPVHSFQGHKDVVKEFVWRMKGGGDSNVDDREFQLVTWSKDQHLRLWPIKDEHLQSIGHKRGQRRRITDKFTRTGHSTHTYRDSPRRKLFTSSQTSALTVPTLKVMPGNRMSSITSYMGPPSTEIYRRLKISPLSWMQGVKIIKQRGEEAGSAGTAPRNWLDELGQVSKKFPQVVFNPLIIPDRRCTISLHSHGPWADDGVAFLQINVYFPEEYPERGVPDFEIQKTGMISMMSRSQILRLLDFIANKCASQKRPCLEACIRYLLGEESGEKYGRSDMDLSRRPPHGRNWSSLQDAGERDDHNVPFPNLCGARFSGNGQLICFFSCYRARDSSNTNPKSARYTYTHPPTYEYFDQYKVISQLPRRFAHLGDDDNPSSDGPDDENESLNLFMYPSIRKQDTVGTGALYQPATKLNRTGYTVYLHDLSDWIPVSKKLAIEYTLLGDDPIHICNHNARVAAKHNRSDLEEIWLLAALILDDQVPCDKRRGFVGSGIQQNVPRSATKRRDSGTAVEPPFIDDNGSFMPFRIQWGYHPFGADLVKKIFQHFATIGDVQTLAMLSCVFREPEKKTVEADDMSTPDSFGSAPLNQSSDYFNYQRNPERLSLSTSHRTNVSSMMNHSFVSHFSDTYSSRGSWHGYYPNDYALNFLSATPTTFASNGFSLGESTVHGINMPIPDSSYHKKTIPGSMMSYPSSGSTADSLPRGSSPAGFASKSENEHMNSDRGDFSISENKKDFEDETWPTHLPLLETDAQAAITYDQYRLAYAKLLYMWGLLEARAELLKFMDLVKSKTIFGGLVVDKENLRTVHSVCQTCGSATVNTSTRGRLKLRCTNESCETNKKNARKESGIKCSICRCLTKGLVSFCIKCNHGGHAMHMRDWFANNNVKCPSGCGCSCILTHLLGEETGYFTFLQKSIYIASTVEKYTS